MNALLQRTSLAHHARASVMLLAICHFATIAAIGQEAESTPPLYQQDPYDTIKLDKENRDAVLKVFPLELPGRAVPDDPKPTDELKLRLIERPDEQFVVLWQNIAEVKLFEHMLLERAGQHVDEQQFDQAYPYYRFLEKNHPRLAGLSEAVEAYLWKQMGLEYKQGRSEQCLALLLELHQRNPRRKGLPAALSRVSLKLIDSHLAAGRYRAARGLLHGLASRYPETSAPTVAKYEGVLTAKAAALIATARVQQASGNLRQAYETTTLAIDVWPDVAGGHQLAAEVRAVYPVVTVAVAALGPTEQSHEPVSRHRGEVDWHNRRIARLTSRTACELVGIGETGGKYGSAFGALELSEDRLRLIFRLAGDGSPSGSATSDAKALFYALPGALFKRADPHSPDFDTAWASAAAAVELLDGQQCVVEFPQPQLRPEVLLTTMRLASASEPAATDLSPGLYHCEAKHAEQAVYLADSKLSASIKQPQQIVECTFANDSVALRALERGDVHAIDRLAPWLWERAAGLPAVRLEPYALPCVHVLVTNPAKPLLGSRTYRRALELGIDRQAILDQAILAGHQQAGCQVVSGPLPRAIDAGDPHGYAYDESIKPRPYDPTLAIMLSSAALQEVAIAEKRLGHSFKAVQTLLVVYPPSAVARMACQSLARQLRLLGAQVTLRELSSGESWPSDFDLAYVELPMYEPLVDVVELLGEGGLSGKCTPAMQAALGDLSRASDWPQARQRLHAIHRLAHREVAVISLWQITPRLARRAELGGVGERPVTLYQNIERWQLGQPQLKTDSSDTASK